MDKHIIGRRDFMKVLGFGGGVALALPRESRTGEVERRKPNVILVITDDQGWGDIHSHGNVLLDTPVMDRLAASGARFDRFYVSPVCAPTRASLLTGRYSLRTGTSGVTRGLETMRAEEVTIAEILKGAGYMCGCFGKWHNGAHYPYHPTGQGFDEFLGFCAGHWNNYFDTSLEH
ncbi:MAG TPA: sulfatase-like hydrolase/transferase, partial [archaeon]|nr:sulfatase-like hydrolase/transferase [archaeon]